MTSPTPSQGEALLTQVNPQSLDELFSRDPLDLADAEVDQVVGVLREARKTWVTAEASGTTRSASAKAPKLAAPKTLALEDLGL